MNSQAARSIALRLLALLLLLPHQVQAADEDEAGIAFVLRVIRLRQRPHDELEVFRRRGLDRFRFQAPSKSEATTPARKGSTSNGPAAEYPLRNNSLTSSYEARTGGVLKTAFVPSSEIT